MASITVLSTSKSILPYLSPRRLLARVGWQYRLSSLHPLNQRSFASSNDVKKNGEADGRERASPGSSDPSTQSTTSSSPPSSSTSQSAVPPDWDENPDLNISAFSQLPHSTFGYNQHMIINSEFKEALRQILWQFRAPIRYAFAYGSGVFPQTASSSKSASTVHAHPSPAISSMQGGQGKMIDFIFGVSYTQHWHSLNLQQHRDHYSAIGSLGSSFVSRVQDNYGAGLYFNPYVTVNGTLIKYGVVNLDTLCRDLSEWDTLYLAGRLQKPVKILRDDPRVRLANQINLISAVRTALLLLPSDFTEQELYGTIAGLSYLGDPRMALPAENPNKVANIIKYQLPNFRRLYAPLIENLPNVAFHDPRCKSSDWMDDPDTNATLAQDMDPKKRGNMVRRLPRSFRSKLYFRYQTKFQIPQLDFDQMLEESDDQDPTRVKKQQGSVFDQRVANDRPEDLRGEVKKAIQSTVQWPSVTQSLKSIVTTGVVRSIRYVREKMEKYREGRKREKGDRSHSSSGASKST
ncbi:Mitochondrial translocator assembly and maintenance protein 41, variant 2 [Xanthoria parietina]